MPKGACKRCSRFDELGDLSMLCSVCLMLELEDLLGLEPGMVVEQFGDEEERNRALGSQGE